MSHHLLFIPSEHVGDRVGSNPLDNVGLAGHRAGAEMIPLGHGPDGAGGGMLCAWRNNTTSRRLHYDAAAQHWFPAVADGELAAGRYWVGTWHDAPVAEADLRHENILHGTDVLLGGQQWHLPAPAFLPHDIVLGRDGAVEMHPKACYQAIALEAHRWRDRLSVERQLVPYIEMFDFVLRCLNLNYRLPRELASELRLLDEENIKPAMLAGMGVDREGRDGEQ